MSDDIELNEGPLADYLKGVTKRAATRVGNSVAAAVGSEKAKGKLDIMNMVAQMKKDWKRWAGQQNNAEPTGNNILAFLRGRYNIDASPIFNNVSQALARRNQGRREPPPLSVPNNTATPASPAQPQAAPANAAPATAGAQAQPASASNTTNTPAKGKGKAKPQPAPLPPRRSRNTTANSSDWNNAAPDKVAIDNVMQYLVSQTATATEAKNKIRDLKADFEQRFGPNSKQWRAAARKFMSQKENGLIKPAVGRVIGNIKTYESAQPRTLLEFDMDQRLHPNVVDAIFTAVARNDLRNAKQSPYSQPGKGTSTRGTTPPVQSGATTAAGAKPASAAAPRSERSVDSDKLRYNLNKLQVHGDEFDLLMREVAKAHSPEEALRLINTPEELEMAKKMLLAVMGSMKGV